jgi:hypothetical protein
VFWNLQDPVRQFHQVAPVLQVIVVVCKASSNAASTGVANLEAVPEVSNTKSIYY